MTMELMLLGCIGIVLGYLAPLWVMVVLSIIVGIATVVLYKKAIDNSAFPGFAFLFLMVAGTGWPILSVAWIAHLMRHLHYV